MINLYIADIVMVNALTGEWVPCVVEAFQNVEHECWAHLKDLTGGYFPFAIHEDEWPTRCREPTKEELAALALYAMKTS